MKREIGIGLAVVAGAALFEAALVPGLIIGGTAWLAPRVLTSLRGKARQQGKSASRERLLSSSRDVAPRQPSEFIAKSQLGRTIAKTITFRLIVTTLDFTTNYIVIGEIATAAGLSTFNLVAGPLFYFTHEAVWNYFGPAEVGEGVRLTLPKSDSDGATTQFTISPALAKTITYRTIATIVDFTTNFVVVGNIADAVILTSTGFFLGPFVYFGHEKAWEYLGGDSTTKSVPAREVALLPAPD
jgi:uncharacterized membrane protein